ncbi:hypothetical protein F4810DRAFT_645234 [Camillea tinctor]|nr:hypothetical protein F4810DRAFT_645234 [Camillea tinctor]
MSIVRFNFKQVLYLHPSYLTPHARFYFYFLFLPYHFILSLSLLVLYKSFPSSTYIQNCPNCMMPCFLLPCPVSLYGIYLYRYACMSMYDALSARG